MGDSDVGHRDKPETFLITGAATGLDDQHRARVRKYLILMAFRVPALVIAGIVYSETHNGLLALAIVAISIPLPWAAVLIANDRPARKRGEKPHYLYGDHHDERAIEPGRPSYGPALDAETVSPPPRPPTSDDAD